MMTNHVQEAQNIELLAIRDVLRYATKTIDCWKKATANCPDCQKLFLQLMEESK